MDDEFHSSGQAKGKKGGKMKAEFIGQEVYYEPLTIFAGTTNFLLLEDPLGVDDDNDPAQDVDATTNTTVAAAEELVTEELYINPHSDIRRVLNHAVCRAVVECGLNARITRITFTLGVYRMADGIFTVIGTETQPTNFANLDGPASRTVRAIIDDTVPMNLVPNERLALRLRVYGFRTAGAIAVPITNWHRRGYDDVMVTIDALYEEV